jgi:hypothetical protein
METRPRTAEGWCGCATCTKPDAAVKADRQASRPTFQLRLRPYRRGRWHQQLRAVKGEDR